MSTERLRSLLHSLRRSVGGDVLGDGELLRRWAAEGDELAFEVLVWRHGPLVLGVCSRILGRPDEIEDAFQATFLALVRKGHTLHDDAALPAWLHRVARRVALRARQTSNRRSERETALLDEPAQPARDADLGEVLDAEIDRLPERYRRAVVLCLLQGHTQQEAARQLGVPVGTVSSLLSRGRDRLRQRLARQDLVPSACALPASLVAPVVRIVLSDASHAAGAVPPRVAELSAGVITEMSRTRILTTVAALAALAVLLAGGFPLLDRLAPGWASDKEQKAQPEPGVRFSLTLLEPFDAKLRLNWKPVRPEPKAVSLTKHKGRLTITAQQGSIHGDEAARKGPRARNLYLIDNPLADDTDFEVSVCVSDFVPKQQYQQAALICYDDDDNYVKWSYEFNWRKGQGTTLTLVRETGAKTEHDNAEPPDSKTVWLRLTRRGADYEYASSGDGKKWTVHGEKPWGSKGPARMGILAKNGGDTKAAEEDVCFSEFRLRAPAPPKVKQ